MKLQRLDLDLSRFRQMFLDEASDQVAVLEAGLLELDRDPIPEEHLDQIFRAAHSLKGNAGMTGFEGVATLTHAIETVLDQLRSGARKPRPALTNLLLRAVDCLKQMLSDPAESPLVEPARQIHDELLAAPVAALAAEYKITWTPPRDCLRRGADPIKVLATLRDFGQILHSQTSLPERATLAELNPETSYLHWTITYRSAAPRAEILDIFSFQALDEDLDISEVAAPTSAANTQSNPTQNSETVRVPASKLDSLFELAGEMILAQSMAMQAIKPDGQQSSLLPILQDLERHTRDLQATVMALRLVPVDQFFRHLPRMVHDISSQLDKAIDLEIHGADTEIDRAPVVEQLNAPLIHLIRNCADHGIESPAEHIRNGKRQWVGSP